MASVSYYQASDTAPPTLLRRVQSPAGLVDEAWAGDSWRPTKAVVDYMFGHNDDVDELSEAQARELVPAAF